MKQVGRFKASDFRFSNCAGIIQDQVVLCPALIYKERNVKI